MKYERVGVVNTDNRDGTVDVRFDDGLLGRYYQQGPMVKSRLKK